MTAGTVAGYKLFEQIGRGGLGVTYRARDTRWGRTVALKVLPEELIRDPVRIGVLFDDTVAAAALSHRGIAPLLAAGEAGGARYLAFDFISGESLSGVIAGRPMPFRSALEIAVLLADALGTMHAAGLVHGDVRPGTILVASDGTPKLLDCGFHRWTRGGATRRAAAADPSRLGPETISTVSYIAPEQALGESIDARADVFSLGTVLYEMLTGRNPFFAPAAQEAVLNVLIAQPPGPSEAVVDVPREIDSLVAKAMSKEMSKRYETAAALAAALRSCRAGELRAERPRDPVPVDIGA